MLIECTIKSVPQPDRGVLANLPSDDVEETRLELASLLETTDKVSEQRVMSRIAKIDNDI